MVQVVICLVEGYCKLLKLEGGENHAVFSPPFRYVRVLPSHGIKEWLFRKAAIRRMTGSDTIHSTGKSTTHQMIVNRISTTMLIALPH